MPEALECGGGPPHKEPVGHCLSSDLVPSAEQPAVNRKRLRGESESSFERPVACKDGLLRVSGSGVGRPVASYKDSLLRVSGSGVGRPVVNNSSSVVNPTLRQFLLSFLEPQLRKMKINMSFT